MTFACLWYVICTAQQLSAVAEVDSGFIYFFIIFVSLHKLSLIAMSPSSSLSVTSALSSSLDRGVTG